MIQLAIAGAAGRMGQSLISACEGHESFALAHAFEQSGHESVGQSAGSGQSSVILTDGIDGPSFDVLIGFHVAGGVFSQSCFLCRTRPKSGHRDNRVVR